MYQMLVVDDEQSVVESLAVTFNWGDMGIGVVHRALSGKQALELMSMHPIDIVITDFRMPGMTGVELIRSIKEYSRKVKCIVLSGHAEFEYAKQALQAEAEDYLLKPVRDNELMDSVKAVLHKISEEWETLSSHRNTVYTLRENLPAIRGTLLHDLLLGKKFKEATLTEKAKLIEVPFQSGDKVSLLLVRMEKGFHHYDSQSVELLEYAIGNITSEILSDHFDIWSCKDMHDYLIFLIKVNSENVSSFNDQQRRQRLEVMALKLQQSVRTYLKGTISVLVGTWGVFPDELSQIYQTAVSILRRQAGNEEEFFIRSDDEWKQSSEIGTLTALYEPPLFQHLLEATRWEEAELKLLSIVEEMSKQGLDSREHLLETFLHVANAFIYISHKNGQELSRVLKQDVDQLMVDTAKWSISHFKSWALSAMELLRGDLSQETIDIRASVVRQVQQFIENNLDGDISVQAIADHVYLHPSYLSKVYKLGTGESLGDYLYRLRMEKAVYLIQNTNGKIYEIAKRLGYASVPYFIKVFKQHYGVTPNEYRERR